MVDLAAKAGATDAVVRKLDELMVEDAGIEADFSELERPSSRLGRERALFWVYEMVGRTDPLEVIQLFVDRVIIDLETVLYGWNSRLAACPAWTAVRPCRTSPALVAAPPQGVGSISERKPRALPSVTEAKPSSH